MYRQFNLPSPPQALNDYLETSLDAETLVLRLRAVVVKAPTGNDWLLLCCTVEAFPRGANKPAAVESRQYPGVLLFEEWLTVGQCKTFIEDVHGGRVAFGTVTIERKQPANWQLELLPLGNVYMSRAGYCATTRFEERGIGYAPGPLLGPQLPYYPDVSEATRDWLPFPVYHGDSDARRQEIIFLLPESRAYFTNVQMKDGIVEIAVGGTEVDQVQLTIKGAYWHEGKLRHFDGLVRDGKTVVDVPNEANRLEYVLVDERGGIYDFQREDRFGLGTRHPHGPVRTLTQRVVSACLDGEGTCTEFKPFIECEDGLGPKSRKTKFRELATTVVAFANTQGGCIYIGIDDECTPCGIGEPLAKWANADVNEEIALRYCRVLTARLRDNLTGAIPLRVSHVFIDGIPIVLVDVSASPAKPVAVTGDNILYVRAGASNRQLPPDQWPRYFGALQSDAASFRDEQPAR